VTRPDTARPEVTLPEAALPEAEAPDAAALEAGRKLFARPARFVWAAQTLDQLPPPGLPEIAFAGRSNAGKSSLLNALTGQASLARVSHTPGRTRQLNFFDLDGRLLLVDLPGYGYARAGRAIKHAWHTTMLEYLRGRPTLRRIVLLMDSRVGPKDSDHEAMALFDRAAVPFMITLTKADAAADAALAGRLAEARLLARRHPAGHPQVIATSSRTGAGIADLRAALAPLAA
jgi:GTP-binding protein